MTKRILVTDTHLGVRGGADLYHTIQSRLFAAIFDYATNNDIKSLLHLGDFWDNRKTVSIKTVMNGLSTVKQCNNIFDEVLLLTGNHDLPYRDDVNISLLSMFRKFGNITIVDKPIQINNILMVPWLFNMDVLNNHEKVDILMGHFDINGCIMNSSGTRAENTRFSQSDFSNFESVYSGHYHTPGTYGNIQYLGSPYQMSFNDINSKRGFYVLDDETKVIEFIEFTDYPKYVRIKDTDNPEDVAGDVPDNIVELIFTKDHGTKGNLEIVELIKSWKPLTLKPTYVNINTMIDKSSTNEEMTVKGHLDILFDLFEKSDIPEGMNPEVLKRVSETIYKEAQSGTE